MKKKMVSAILAIAMTATLLTACGGDKGANTSAAAPAATTPAPAAIPAPAANDTKADAPAETTDAAEGEMVSDEVFEMLQDNYAMLVEYHDAVVELYNDDQIVANAEIEDTINQVYDIIKSIKGWMLFLRQYR